MGMTDIDRFPEQREMDVGGVHRRLILALATMERVRWHAIWLLAQGWTAFATAAEVRAHGIAPGRRGHPAYQYMRYADGDGVVCE